ncbi:MAG: hypothetical protein OIF50_13330, partial [Flavobacteriaceae bacterium]|nr:hypothetical protein [Flavobacteriaceae bacterium]
GSGYSFVVGSLCQSFTSPAWASFGRLRGQVQLLGTDYLATTTIPHASTTVPPSLFVPPLAQ